MGSLSLREYIRWLPDDPGEPTSTLVVTSPNRHFVDIRVKRPDGASRLWPEKEEHIAMNQLDWGIAGRSSYWKPDPNSLCTRGRWEHWIDSRTTETNGLADEGDNYTQADGTTLEKGRMVNPDTGKDTDYEELWKDLDPLPVNSANVRGAVLQVDGVAKCKGSVVLVGQFCQGILRDADEVTVERWYFDAEKGWRCLISMGNGALPCSSVLKTNQLVEGETIITSGTHWRVIEASGY